MERLVPSMVEDIDRRLDELRPAVQEAETLLAVRSALAGQDHGRTSTTSAPRPLEKVVAGPARRARSGSNRDAIMAFLAGGRVASSEEIAAGTGISKPVVMSTVSKLHRAAELAKRVGHSDGLARWSVA